MHADVSVALTLTLCNKSNDLKRCGGRFICLYLFFSVGYLQVTTQRPITWKMAQWSRPLTTLRYGFFSFTLFIQWTLNHPHTHPHTHPSYCCWPSLSRKLHDCVGGQTKKKSHFAPRSAVPIPLEIALRGEDAFIGERAHFVIHV